MAKMSAVKKRKLNTPVVTPPLSAIAARRAKAQSTGDTTPAEEPVPANLSTPVLSILENKKLKQDAEDTPKVQDSVNTTTSAGVREPILKLDEEGPSSSYESRAVSPETPIPRPTIVFSTLRPSEKTILEDTDGSLLLRLEPGERLVILGQFELSVKKGQVILLGSTLQASKSSYRVFAPSSHSLPVIRCASNDFDHSEVRIRQCDTGLGSMKSLSALFGSLWNDQYGPLSKEYSHLIKRNGKSSYKILFTSQDGPPKGFIQPLISPPEWNAAIARSSENTKTKTPSIMLCGPKSSGKSTFAKILANRLLSTSSHSSKISPGVAILDLDPGQPEYSTPGQISLTHIQEPNFGPPFSHPIPDGKSRIIRSHAIGAISPSLDPSLYMACALDLSAHYRNLLSTTPNCPLVINTPGWVLGTGLEILVDLITKVHPTEVLYMSLDGPSEVVDSLREASNPLSIPLFTLPSQGSEYATRTAAHLRTMQNMSYFHLSTSISKPKKKELSWKDTPLTSLPPWQVGYSGGEDEAGILGVMCYGEQPPADLLADTIDGALVAVVVIDDMSAIPGWSASSPLSSVSQPPTTTNTTNNLDLPTLSPSHPSHLTTPLLLSTPHTQIPYFNPSNAITLDPQRSHTIGLALIRGIDSARKCLQIITPIEAAVVRGVREEGKKIVLVCGKLDTPGWAYTEEFVQKGGREKEVRRRGEVRTLGGVDAEDDGGGGDNEDVLMVGESGTGFKEDAPWVEKLHGSQGRGVGSRVWRVRRDLGKSGDWD